MTVTPKEAPTPTTLQPADAMNAAVPPRDDFGAGPNWEPATPVVTKPRKLIPFDANVC